MATNPSALNQLAQFSGGSDRDDSGMSAPNWGSFLSGGSDRNEFAPRPAVPAIAQAPAYSLSPEQERARLQTYWSLPEAQRGKDSLTTKGFVPGFDRGEWLWADTNNDMVKALYGRQLPGVDVGYGGGSDQAGTGGGGTWESILGWNTGNDQKLPGGEGRWINPNVANTNIGWSPEKGATEIHAKMKDMPMGQVAKAVVMAMLAAGTGGAALAALPAGMGALAAGAISGAAAGLPSAMYTGLNTGDWGKAAMNVGAGAIGGGVVGGLSQYGSSLASSMNIPTNNPMLNYAGNTALKAGTNMAKAALTNNDVANAGKSSVMNSGVKGVSDLASYLAQNGWI